MKTLKLMLASTERKKGSAHEKRALRFPEALFLETRRLSRLALRELEAAAGLGLAVLLALDDTAVARQEALGLQQRAQARLEIGQRLGDAVADGTGLAGET